MTNTNLAQISTIQSVTGYTINTDWISSTAVRSVHKYGKLVNLNFSGTINGTTSVGYRTFVSNLPKAVVSVITHFQTANGESLGVSVNTDGTLQTSSNNPFTSGWYTGEIIYLTND